MAADPNHYAGYTDRIKEVKASGWNGEDLSIYSAEGRHCPSDLHSGGRALPALVRPYARKVSGIRLVPPPAVAGAR